MKLQVLKDNSGNQTGIFLPIENWKLIKDNYPDIELIDQELSQQERDLIDSRLDAIAKAPKRLRPISELLEELNKIV